MILLQKTDQNVAISIEKLCEYMLKSICNRITKYMTTGTPTARPQKKQRERVIMGFLDRAIKNGINKAVGTAVQKGVEQGVSKVVAPRVEQAANKAADSINKATNAPEYTGRVDNEGMERAAGSLGSLFGSYQNAAMSFANEAAKNMKICPSCGASASADTKFCPSCGGKLPDGTVAGGAKCPQCGKQNSIGVRFCAECGAKLPAAEEEERLKRSEFDAVMSKWDTLLPQYPKWSFGGEEADIIECGTTDDGQPFYQFSVKVADRRDLGEYRELLKQNGFTKAGKYPSEDSLYKMIGGRCYMMDSSEAFSSGENYMTISFAAQEPAGGFDYKEPEKKIPTSFRDLFR